MELTQIKSLLIDLFKNDFANAGRQRPSVYQRAIFYRLCRDFTPYCLTDIGAVVGRDHASVIHGLKVFKNLKLWKEQAYLDIYSKARKKLKQDMNCANPHLNKSYEEKYKELLLKHILLKEKFYKLKKENEVHV